MFMQNDHLGSSLSQVFQLGQQTWHYMGVFSCQSNSLSSRSPQDCYLCRYGLLLVGKKSKTRDNVHNISCTFPSIPSLRPGFHTVVSELMNWLDSLCLIGNIDLSVCMTGMSLQLKDNQRYAGHGREREKPFALSLESTLKPKPTISFQGAHWR